MSTVKSLQASLDRPAVWARFPVRSLALALVLVAAAAIVFSVVDRVAPPPQGTAAGAAPAVGGGALVAVVAVLAAAVGAMFVLKRLLRGNRCVPAGQRVLKVRDVLAIGPKRAIYLIALEERNLVVGLSGDQLSLLSEYSSVTEADEPVAAPAIAATVPAHVDIEIGDDPTPEAAATPPARAFSFAPTHPAPARTQANRVPHKFRNLVEAAAAEGGAR